MAEATMTKTKPSRRKVGTPTPEGVGAKSAPKASKKAPVSPKSGFAVIMTGGKQYRVTPGMRLKIEKMLGDHKEGDTIVFKEVLLKGTNENDLVLGFPLISGAKVSATLTKISRYKTVDVIHYKQKSRYFKKYGHRQPYFEVQIDSIA